MITVVSCSCFRDLMDTTRSHLRSHQLFIGLMYMYQQKLLSWQEISPSKHINVSYTSVGCQITTIYTFPIDKDNHIIWQVIFVTYFVVFHLFIKLPFFPKSSMQLFLCICVLFKNYYNCFISAREKYFS